MHLYKILAVSSVIAVIPTTVLYIYMSYELGKLQRHHNDELRAIASEMLTNNETSKLSIDNKGKSCSVQNPTLEYETTRRSAIRDILELWNFLNNEMKNLLKTLDKRTTKTLERIHYLTSAHKGSILNYLQMLREVDGSAEWRQNEEVDLSTIIQKRLEYLQNPTNCQRAKKVLCWFKPVGCGYGCQMHHLVYCLLVAYGTNRTLVLDTTGWNYGMGLTDLFQPLSETCTTYDSDRIADWPGTPDDQVIRLPLIGAMTSRPDFLPLSIPKDISQRLIRFHGDPAVWWLNQLLKFVMRPTEKLDEILRKANSRFRVKGPIAGVQVRRTDKLKEESKFYNISDYMEHVDDYYHQLELIDKKVVRQVYLATDDPAVSHEAAQRYPSYKFYTNLEMTQIAENDSTRYNADGLVGIVLDIYFLSKSDYLVCTFSSNICRMAYTLMQSETSEPWTKYRSLDADFYFSSQKAHYSVARYSYQPMLPGEIELQPGDVIANSGNLWTGYSVGKNLRTKQNGRFPSITAVKVVDAVPMPAYPEITQRRDRR